MRPQIRQILLYTAYKSLAAVLSLDLAHEGGRLFFTHESQTVAAHIHATVRVVNVKVVLVCAQQLLLWISFLLGAGAHAPSISEPILLLHEHLHGVFVVGG